MKKSGRNESAKEGKHPVVIGVYPLGCRSHSRRFRIALCSSSSAARPRLRIWGVQSPQQKHVHQHEMTTGRGKYIQRTIKPKLTCDIQHRQIMHTQQKVCWTLGCGAHRKSSWIKWTGAAWFGGASSSARQHRKQPFFHPVLPPSLSRRVGVGWKRRCKNTPLIA